MTEEESTSEADSSGHRARDSRSKGGRPKGARRGAKVELRLSADEKASLQQSAGEAGLTVSEYVRRRSLGRPVAARADRETRVLLRRIGVNLNQLARSANTSGASASEQRLYEALTELRAALASLG